jgi:ParB family chromosome partitioning protein
LGQVETLADIEVVLDASDFVEVYRKGDLAIIKPKQFLGDTTFSDIHDKIKKMGGTYVSAGKNSHWEMPLPLPTIQKPMKKCERCGNPTQAPTLYEGKKLCTKCLSEIKSSLEQEVPKTAILVKNVKEHLSDAKASAKGLDIEKSLSFKPFQLLPVEAILSMPFQIRQNQEIDPELADSIRQVGIVEPLIVRPKESGMFEIVCGERRLSHAKEVGLTQVPCVVRLLTDEEALEIQLIENVQRKDVSDIEIAHWLDRLIKKYPDKYPTQEVLAKRVGKSQEWVSKHLALVRAVESNIIPSGIMEKTTEFQARELISAPEEKRQEIIEHIEESGVVPSAREIHELAHPESPKLPEPCPDGICHISKEEFAKEIGIHYPFENCLCKTCDNSKKCYGEK